MASAPPDVSTVGAVRPVSAPLYGVPTGAVPPLKSVMRSAVGFAQATVLPPLPVEEEPPEPVELLPPEPVELLPPEPVELEPPLPELEPPLPFEPPVPELSLLLAQPIETSPRLMSPTNAHFLMSVMYSLR